MHRPTKMNQRINWNFSLVKSCIWVLLILIFLENTRVCAIEGLCKPVETYCELSNGLYGCCPYSHATCCADQKHCCPSGYHCVNQTCVRQRKLTRPTPNFIYNMAIPYTQVVRTMNLFLVGSNVQKSAQVIEANKPGTPCPNIICPPDNTCCINREITFVCCPFKDAACCSDGAYCCPYGSYCLGKFRCKPIHT